MSKLSEKETIVIYCGLVNALIDHIDVDFRPSKFNRQNVKFLSNNLLKELLKMEASIYEGREEVELEVTEQYVEAGKFMLNFFKLGLEMTEMDVTRQLNMNDELNFVLRKYGIQQEF
jgi:hypothetical protein